MGPKAEAHERLRAVLQRRRITTLNVLLDALGTPSRMTVYRRLSEIGYRSSFTHRGRYYTLVDVPRFDPQGLWFYEDVGFSRFGTLKQTVAELVPEAPEGRTHGELAALLRVRAHNPLLDLVESGALGRRGVEGVGEFVYVSADPTRADQQIARRLELLHERALQALPPDETVLAILVETLRASPLEVPPELVVRRLAARGVRVSQQEVERVFEHHGVVGGKKKGPIRISQQSQGR